MLPKLHEQLESGREVTLRRTVGGEDRTPFGAFARGEVITLCAEVPRTFGAEAVVLRFAPDGEETRDIPFSFAATDFLTDRYETVLDTAALCDGTGGLFWYELLLVRGSDTLFSDSTDNVHFTLSPHNGTRFRLLVYAPEFHPPAWLAGATMYHVFVDRFCRDANAPPVKPGAKLNPDWRHGIPEFAARNGDPLENRTFFGGTLDGVTEQLDRLREYGVTVLYLSPIFDARSNHRYDTGDYETVDPAIGGDAAFDRLIAAAHARGMHVILDGVFNHTGDDSRYFNRYGTYPTVGAYQSPQSPYARWYSFRHFPDDYACWWGIPILPKLNQSDPDCRRYFTAPGGIIARWLTRGADGWRLDVADELPDAFLDELRQVAKQVSGGEAAVIGEVCENAADKIAYGHRRRYLRGGQLDSVMNYPFRDAVLAFARGQTDAYALRDFLIGQQMNYPKPLYYSLMNLLGSHDVDRIRTALCTGVNIRSLSREEQVRLSFTDAQLAAAVETEKLCALLQFAIPGVPSIYYGDEQGMCGVCDPFNRQPFKEGVRELHDFYARLAAKRRGADALSTGEAVFMAASADVLMVLRYINGDKDALGESARPGAYLAVINRGAHSAGFTADCTAAGCGMFSGCIAAHSGRIFELSKEGQRE